MKGEVIPETTNQTNAKSASLASYDTGTPTREEWVYCVVLSSQTALKD